MAEPGAPVRRRRRTARSASAAAEPAEARGEDSASAAAHARGERTDEDKRVARNEMIKGTVIRLLVMMGIFMYKGSGDVKRDGAAAAVQASGGGGGGGVAPMPKAEPGLLSAFMPPGMAPKTGPTPKYYEKVLGNAWAQGKQCDLKVFVSESDALGVAEVRALGLQPVWAEDGVLFNFLEENSRAKNVSLPVPEAVGGANGSWWVHAFLAVPEVWSENEDVFGRVDLDVDLLYAKHNVVTWVKKPKVLKGLLDGGDEKEEEGKEKEKEEEKEKEKEKEKEEENEDGPQMEQMWKPVVPIELVAEGSNMLLSQMPPNVASEYRPVKGDTKYVPPLVVNEFWVIRDALQQMNETVGEVTLEMTFRPVGLTRWSMMKSIEGMWDSQMKMGAMRENEPDDLKRMFLETNPVLLGTTMVVSLAHSLLEMLAFKSDIAHWKDIKNMEGVSVRSMMWNIGMQLIIFLYLFDNETSWMIVIGNGIGIMIEVWKLRKVVKIKSFGKKKALGFIPWFELEHDESYASETQEYDDEAMRYLSYLIYPCVVGYAIYTLKYEKHKSWYSWVINSLVGAVYTFGFLMMLPQVIINYRLKSVAHMPMKSFAFKALNTIIDDLFSFIIKMPTLHRVACFRDDVVFLIYLYQMYIYPVDHKRVNEFGQRSEAADDVDKKDEGGATTDAKDKEEDKQKNNVEKKND